LRKPWLLDFINHTFYSCTCSILCNILFGNKSEISYSDFDVTELVLLYYMVSIVICYSVLWPMMHVHFTHNNIQLYNVHINIRRVRNKNNDRRWIFRVIEGKFVVNIKLWAYRLYILYTSSIPRDSVYYTRCMLHAPGNL